MPKQMHLHVALHQLIQVLHSRRTLPEVPEVQSDPGFLELLEDLGGPEDLGPQLDPGYLELLGDLEGLGVLGSPELLDSSNNLL